MTEYQLAAMDRAGEHGEPIFRAPSVGCSGETDTGRISMGAGNSTPQCSTCTFRAPDPKYPGWGWCGHPSNRVFVEGWPLGFTPSQSPSGTCRLHPDLAATGETS